jgi:hypothetical protein
MITSLTGWDPPPPINRILSKIDVINIILISAEFILSKIEALEASDGLLPVLKLLCVHNL